MVNMREMMVRAATATVLVGWLGAGGEVKAQGPYGPSGTFVLRWTLGNVSSTDASFVGQKPYAIRIDGYPGGGNFGEISYQIVSGHQDEEVASRDALGLPRGTDQAARTLRVWTNFYYEEFSDTTWGYYLDHDGQIYKQVVNWINPEDGQEYQSTYWLFSYYESDTNPHGHWVQVN